MIENFRPGTLEKWDLGWEELSAVNPRLVLTRVTGFGQFGPYARRPGFGTLAEAMSGFAAVTGEPDGPPTLPPFGLADSIAALTTSYAVMAALRGRDTTGRGQVVDMAHHRTDADRPRPAAPLVRPARLRPAAHRQPLHQQRAPQHLPHRRRLLGGGLHLGPVHRRAGAAAGRPAGRDRRALVRDRRGPGRARRRPSTRRSATGSPATTAPRYSPPSRRPRRPSHPVYDIRDVMADAQYQALGSITEVPDEELGTLRMQNVLFRLSETPGRHPLGGPPARRGHRRGADRARDDRHGDRRAARGGRPVTAAPAGRPGTLPVTVALTWLYVPGDRPEVVTKALGCGADVVLVDLEDAVAPDRKDYALRATAELLSDAAPGPAPVHVRVNALDGPRAETEIRTLAALPGLAGLRLPKVQGPADVLRAARLGHDAPVRRTGPLRPGGLGPSHRPAHPRGPSPHRPHHHRQHHRHPRPRAPRTPRPRPARPGPPPCTPCWSPRWASSTPSRSPPRTRRCAVSPSARPTSPRSCDCGTRRG